MSVTVAQVITMAKQKADMLNSNFVSSSEWISYCDRSWKELYDILTSKFEDYYTVMPPLVFSINAGNTYTLPADFYKMRGMDRATSGTEYYTIRPFTFEDRNNRRRQALFRGLYPTVRYRIIGNTLIFTPDDGSTGTYRMWYIPRATDLTTDSDTIDGVNGWEEYVAVDMAIKALQKEESDVSVLMAQKAALKQRIEDLAQNRDAGETERVTDITTGGSDNPLFYPGGY